MVRSKEWQKIIDKRTPTDERRIREIANQNEEIERLRAAIRSFERANTELRRAEATMEQPRLQRAGNRFATARYRLFLTAKQSSVCERQEGKKDA